MIIEHIDEISEELVQTIGKNGGLSVNALITNPFVEAILRGDAYIWSTLHTSGNDDHIIYLRNTSVTKNLHITNMGFGGKTGAVFTLNAVTGLGNGVPCDEFNMDFSGDVADAVHLQNDVFNLGVITQIAHRVVADSGGSSFGSTDFILKTGDAITIQVSRGSADTIAAIKGFFEDIPE